MCTFLTVFLACPVGVWAAGNGGTGSGVPVWLCIPFAGLLLCVAVMPLVKGEWWKSHQHCGWHSGSFLWSFRLQLFTVPEKLRKQYWSAWSMTILHLSSCYSDCSVYPVTLQLRVILRLAKSKCRTSCTGNPAFQLYRNYRSQHADGPSGDQMNSWRKRKGHIMIFFIFMVSNMGGCLTPIGDPPLLMGFMRGVPFFWSLHLFPVLIFNMVILLFVFYHLDMRSYKKDIAEGRKTGYQQTGYRV